MNRTMEISPCPEQLNDEQIAAYWRDGYLAFTDVLSRFEVEAARLGLRHLVRKVVDNPASQQHGAFWTLPGSRFGIQFEAGYTPRGETFDAVELKVRKLMWYCEQSSLFHYLAAEHLKIQAVMTAVLGANPILFQDMALIKPPYIGSEKPWHQDDAYFAVTPLEMVCGVWIALDEATAQNGCMHVLQGAHRAGPQKHFHDRDCEIRPDRLEKIEALERAVPIALPPGGALFFSGLLPHQTPPNQSSQRRRALQFHYRGAQTASVSREEYDTIFCEADGTPASCAAER